MLLLWCLMRHGTAQGGSGREGGQGPSEADQLTFGELKLKMLSPTFRLARFGATQISIVKLTMISKHCLTQNSPPQPALLECLPTFLENQCASDFNSVDTYFEHVLSKTMYEHSIRIRCLTGFGARVRAGRYGHGKQIQAATVSGTISAVRQTIALARGVNPTKVSGSDKYGPRIRQMIDGMAKEAPLTLKKLPVEVDAPEFIADAGRHKVASPLTAALGDMALIAFYYVLRVGEYTVKGSWNNSMQTEQFCLCNVTFFIRDKQGKLRQMRRDASDENIMATHSATMKLGNQKNGWKNV